MKDDYTHFIPDKQYISIEETRSRTSSLGFAVAYFDFENGHSEQQEKRMNKADRWSKGDSLGPFIHNNRPRSGFELRGYSGRYRSNNKWWRVRDPRGFLLEISLDNLNELLDYCDVVDRELQRELIWLHGKGSHKVKLVPPDDSIEEYRKAKEYTKVRRSKEKGERLSLRNLNRGDVVQKSTGEEVEYLGGLYFIGRKRGGSQVQRDYFYRDLEEDKGNEQYKKSKSFNSHVLLEETDDPLTEEDAAEEVNNHLNRMRKVRGGETNVYGMLAREVFFCHPHGKFGFEDIDSIKEDLTNEVHTVTIDGESFELKHSYDQGSTLKARVRKYIKRLMGRVNG